jgi:quercetin dioxygenase-like cupin family protein
MKKVKIALLLVMACWTTAVMAQEQVKQDVLLKTSQSWDGVAYKGYPAGEPEITVLKIIIPPNTSLPWHTHPMPNAAYVLAGELTVEKKQDGSKRQLHAGETLPEMVDALHRGYTGKDGATLIVFYAGSKGQALSHKQP